MDHSFDGQIRALWDMHPSSEIARLIGMAERTVRFRATRMGLTPHRRGRKAAVAAINAVVPKVPTDAISATLPISSREPLLPPAILPRDFEAFRPGAAPQPPVRRDW